MIIRMPSSKFLFHLPGRCHSSGRARYDKISIRQALLILVLGIIILSSSCETPQIQPAQPGVLIKSNLSFIQDGVTTREQVVLKFGIPSMQLEGDRIMMYQLFADNDGKWNLVTPMFSEFNGLRIWQQGTCSLVLVFGPDGVLRKHSLVTSTINTQ